MRHVRRAAFGSIQYSGRGNHRVLCASLWDTVGEWNDDDLSREVPTEDDLVSVGTFATLVHDLTSGVDLMQILYGHYPGVYIAWMQTVDGGDLRQTQ